MKTSKISIPLLGTGLLILLTACAANERGHTGENTASPPAEQTDSSFIPKLEELNGKDPLTDVQASIARGDNYFLCNAGRSRTVPGLDEETYTQVRQNCQTRCLDGMTDAVLGKHHLRYLQAAITYSASWNKTMINVCR